MASVWGCVPVLVAGLLVCCGVWAADTNAAPQSVAFSHKDWELACDNTRTCRAVGYQRDADNEKPLALLLERPAGVATVTTARLMLGNYGQTQPTPADLTVRVNGRSLGVVTIAKNTGIGELNALQTAAVLVALPKIADVQFVSGQHRWQLSDDGAAAVLLKMDEAQGRLGTATALVKKGNASDSGVLPPLPVPWVQSGGIDTSKPIDALLAAAIKPLLTTGNSDCSELKDARSQAQTPPPELLQVWRLNATQLLVSALCWRAAYNAGHGYWLVNDKPPYQQHLITDSGSHYSHGVISASHKGRGLGDCWGHDEWVWNGVGFVHSSASTTGMCKLVAPGGAWKLPILVSRVLAAP